MLHPPKTPSSLILYRNKKCALFSTSTVSLFTTKSCTNKIRVNVLSSSPPKNLLQPLTTPTLILTKYKICFSDHNNHLVVYHQSHVPTKTEWEYAPKFLIPSWNYVLRYKLNMVWIGCLSRESDRLGPDWIEESDPPGAGRPLEAYAPS